LAILNASVINRYLPGRVLVLALFWCLAQTAAQGQQQLAPNIVFILADDLGYGDLKVFNPDARIPTPHLSRLAEQGMMFRDAHTSSSVCTPSRYSILTGRYAFRSSLKKGVLGGYSPALIEDDRFTIADLAKKAGYQTAIIGKWHLGMNWKPVDPAQPAIRNRPKAEPDLSNIDFNSPVRSGPNTLGFDYSYIIPASLDMSPYVYLENGKCIDTPLVPFEGTNTERGVFWRGGYASKSFKIANTLDHFIDKAGTYIRQAGSARKPFFLYLPLTAPHTPWLPADGFRNRSGAGTYGDFVAHVDDAVGRILQLLDSLNLTGNTMVVFTSDNGADWKQKDKETYPGHQANYIFRGEKSDIWEGGHRVPLIIRWPAQVPKGQTNADPVCLADFMATFAALMHQQLPEGAGPDSFNYWPRIKGAGGRIRTDMIHHSINGMFAIRKGRWKFIDGKGSGGWSPANPDDGAPGQLYNIEKDIRETTNLYSQYPDVVKELRALLEQRKAVGSGDSGK